MNRNPRIDRIMAAVPSMRFVGRSNEQSRIADACRDGESLVMLAPPMAGATELLRQCYDSLFRERSSIIPIYFEFRRSDKNARSAALRFVREFLIQTVAFRRNDPGIIRNSPEICEIAELATPQDGYWIDRLIETCHSGSILNDEAALLSNCASAPLRAANAGVRIALLIDAVHIADELEGGRALADELFRLYNASPVACILSGYRRALFGRGEQPVLELSRLSPSDASRCIDDLAAAFKIETTDQSRDLIALQSDRRPGVINYLLRSAGDRLADLTNFDSVERIYTDETFGGRIGRRFDDLIATVISDAATRGSILAFLRDVRHAENETYPIAYWQKRVTLSPDKTRSILRILHVNEVINLTDGGISTLHSPLYIRDLIDARIDLEVENRPRALSVGEAISRNVRRAPVLMTEQYRRGTAIGLRDVLGAIDGRPISPVLFDYKRFRDELKGADRERSLNLLREANDKFDTPKITFAGSSAAFYPAISEIVEKDRSAVGIGQSSGPERSDIAVIAVEVESKLEADAATTEFWLDRMEMLAAHCNFANYRIWLVSSEGFNDEAMRAIRSRGAYSSSRAQVELLRDLLNQPRKDAAPSSDDYEVVIPMGDDTEMIAAHMIEEVGRRHGIDAKTLNKIKTAVVEACINATEHGHSPDRKIYLRFGIAAGKAAIIVFNRGVRMDESKLQIETPADGRRGWGFKLMRNLMDDVIVEHSDEGTRVTLIKDLIT